MITLKKNNHEKIVFTKISNLYSTQRDVVRLDSQVTKYQKRAFQIVKQVFKNQRLQQRRVYKTNLRDFHMFLTTIFSEQTLILILTVKHKLQKNIESLTRMKQLKSKM